MLWCLCSPSGLHLSVAVMNRCVVFCICCICLFSIEWVHLWLGLSFHSMRLVTHIYDLQLKKSLFVLFWDFQRCACGPVVDRKLYKPTMPPSSNTNTQMACLMISILTGCQYILLLLKGLGLNLRIQRSSSLDWLSKLLLSKLVQTWCLTLQSY